MSQTSNPSHNRSQTRSVLQLCRLNDVLPLSAPWNESFALTVSGPRCFVSQRWNGDLAAALRSLSSTFLDRCMRGAKYARPQ